MFCLQIGQGRQFLDIKFSDILLPPLAKSESYFFFTEMFAIISEEVTKIKGRG